MNKRLSQVVAPVVFLGLLAVPLAIKNLSARHESTPEPVQSTLGRGSAPSRYGFRLTESAKVAGIDFTHQAPQLDKRLDHIMPQIASMGAGVAVSDFDRDGWADFYVTNSGEGSANRLYRNTGKGSFEEVAAKTGVAELNRMPDGVSMGAVWGDYDNDGWEDLLVYKWGRTQLFHNEKGRKFRDV
ncbi:MAG: enediyne biosynthesis protein, partial [Abditibacteriota bacterium]|nr:enediyne biosynthesis protein [Abditibacteriota bacterium]